MAGSLRTTSAAALLLMAARGAGAASRPVTLDMLTAEPPPGALDLTELRWRGPGHELTFLAPEARDPKRRDLVEVEAGSRRRRTIVRAEDLPKRPGKGTASLASYRWSPGGGELLFEDGGDFWLYTPARRAFSRLTRDGKPKEFPGFSPDGQRVAFVEGNDLYCADVATGRLTRLSSDGRENLEFNGRLDWVYEEELASRSGRSYAWAPDSRSIAYIHLDDSPVPTYPIVDYGTDHETTFLQHYPQAGESNPVAQVRIVRVDGTKGPRVAFTAADDVYVVPRLTWTPDSRAVSYQVLNRAQTRLDVELLDAASGQSRRILTEKDPDWINVSNFAEGGDAAAFPFFLRDGRRYLWLSARTGYRHLYLGDLASGRISALTSGAWQVERVDAVDERSGTVDFESTDPDVRDRRLCRLSIARRTIAPLARHPGTVRDWPSPDSKYLLLRESDLRHPPLLAISRSDGSRAKTLEDASSSIAGLELGSARLVDVTARDGTLLHAMLLLPPDFDVRKKYPVIVGVYGGPDVQVVRDAWGTAGLFDHLLADRGFIVWKLDNRGSWGRGHAFETPIFHRMGARELSDQLDGVRYLESLPYVDASRIGIWGWSYGGYMTLYAVTHAPQVWKCAIAGAPVTDWRFYDSVYTERYMGRPADNPAGYRDSAPRNFAADIRAKLLEIHGTSDDNVHLQNTIEMIDAMTRAGVPYELELQPGQKHGFRGKTSRDYLNRQMLEFFEKNL